MGGGGAMRAAGKIAGFSTLTSSFRGSAVAENPVTLSARKGVKPVSASLVSVTPTGELNADQAIQKPTWEFSGSEEEFVVDRINMNKPRMVFGPVPTLEETKEATTELKDALNQVYFSSPKSSGIGNSVSDGHETKACIIHESVPKSAMQAFKLLKESSAAQNVVAKIACDPNVWNAVMQNPSLMEFLELEKKSTMFEPNKFDGEEFSSRLVESSEYNVPEEPDGLMAFLENVKVTVVDVVQYLTNLVESWFSSPKVEQREGNFAGGSFMALAMMVIMVVVLKR